ncbi:MAG: hypothetical protein WBE86_03975 [Candidatus Acidiferrales bacterium]
MKFPAIPKSVFPSSLVKTVLVCAVSLCFAAAAPAAFAQRGGGGSHGGGGRASAGSRGGVGGFHASSGGSRVSTGSAGRASGASRSYASSGTLYAHGTSARGYSRNTFVPGPGSRAGNGANSSFFSVNSPSPVGARPFAANNFLWEDPPQQARPVMPMPSPRPMMPMQSPRPIFAPLQAAHPAFPAQPVHFPFIRQPIALASPRASPNALFHPLSRRLVAGPPFVGMAETPFHSLHFRRQPCFGMINPCGFGGGFGFGSPFFNPFFFSPFGFGFGSSCFFADAFEPCGFGPFGLDGDLLGYGYDYGNGYFYSPAEEPPAPPWNADEDTTPAEFPTYSVEYPFLPAPLPPPVPYSGVGQGTAPQPVVKLVLKDGTIFGVNYYWLADGRLNYITTYNIQTSIPLDDLDLQKTVDLNYKLGITFTLTPQPPTSPQQQPPQPPDAQPQPQNQ